MKLKFLPRALDIYKELKASNPSLASKIKSFIADAIEYPATVMDEPTKLVGIVQKSHDSDNTDCFALLYLCIEGLSHRKSPPHIHCWLIM